MTSPRSPSICVKIEKRLNFLRTSKQAVSRSAVIDIGSNSVRIVVYEGPARAPAVIFNEKVAAGLGRGLAIDGRIAPEDSTSSAERRGGQEWVGTCRYRGSPDP